MKQHSLEESGAFIQTFSLPPTNEGMLSGLKFAVKDNIDVKGYITGNGNPTWAQTHPVAAAHAICVEQILQAGAHCIGKTIMSELAFAIDGENHFYGTPLNSKAPDRVPGGSSSGSASAVACGLVDFALGTDAGGSVRVPASNCGVFGMRPSHDSISITGLCPFASTFDTVGFFASNIEVLQKVGSVLLSCEVVKEKIGTIYLVKEAFSLCDKEVNHALEKPLSELKRVFGVHIKEISLGDLMGNPAASNMPTWLQTFTPIQWSEVWTALGSWIESAKPEFGPRIQKSFELAKNLDRSQISSAIAQREILYRQLKNALGPNDLLCIPTTPALAPLKGSLGLDRSTGDYFPRLFSLTSLSGIARLPQISLPLGSLAGIPMGLSLLAANGRDAFLLHVAGEVANKLG